MHDGPSLTVMLTRGCLHAVSPLSSPATSIMESACVLAARIRCGFLQRSALLWLALPTLTRGLRERCATLQPFPPRLFELLLLLLLLPVVLVVLVEEKVVVLVVIIVVVVVAAGVVLGVLVAMTTVVVPGMLLQPGAERACECVGNALRAAASLLPVVGTLVMLEVDGQEKESCVRHDPAGVLGLPFCENSGPCVGIGGGTWDRKFGAKAKLHGWAGCGCGCGCAKGASWVTCICG